MTATIASSTFSVTIITPDLFEQFFQSITLSHTTARTSRLNPTGSSIGARLHEECNCYWQPLTPSILLSRQVCDGVPEGTIGLAVKRTGTSCELLLLDTDMHVRIAQNVAHPVGTTGAFSVEVELAIVISKPNLDRPWSATMAPDGREIEHLGVSQ
jgi:hypothetical protein